MENYSQNQLTKKYGTWCDRIESQNKPWATRNPAGIRRNYESYPGCQSLTSDTQRTEKEVRKAVWKTEIPQPLRRKLSKTCGHNMYNKLWMECKGKLTGNQYCPWTKLSKLEDVNKSYLSINNQVFDQDERK